MMENKNMLRVAGIVNESVTDGPGLRFVIFTQGCPRCCVGCHNHETQSFAGGADAAVDELLEKIFAIQLIDGITLTGGEPFAQARACAVLARAVRARGMSVVTYSGYYLAELEELATRDVGVRELLDTTDILIDGPFEVEKRDLDLPFRGSTNQNILKKNGALWVKF